jgi:putative spermidine/putrescine transport system permease protein
MFDSHSLWRLATKCAGLLVLVFLLAPILAIIPLSFNSTSTLSYPLAGFSTEWYAKLMAEPRWLTSIKNSLIVAAATVALATPLGTFAALGLSMVEFRGKSAVVALLMLPMIVPTIITAVGAYFAFAQIGLANSLTGLILSHVVLATPFVVITVAASVAQLDRLLLRAASSLGAGPLRSFFAVTLPLIRPGVISGAIFAFSTSFDEVVVAVLLTGPEQRTLPRELLSGTRENLDPTVMAVATLLILFSTALLLAVTAMQSRANRLRTP